MQTDFLSPDQLSSAEEFKQPDPWVHLGEYLDQPGDNNGPSLTARLGIDFGTAYTKVAYNIADKVYFVKWSGVRVTDNSDGYFLPGEMSIKMNGSLVLGICPIRSDILQNLKNPFLGDQLSDTDNYFPIVIFVAWIFQYTRAWIYKNHEDLISRRKIVYQVNFGKPSSKFSWKYDDKYTQIVSSAWQLSQLKYDDFTLENAKHFFEANSSSKKSSIDTLGLIPEFAAQIAGYIHSPQRRNDLHIFFDIGAGTIDVSLFSLYKKLTDEAGEEITVLASDVQPYGTHFLKQEKILENVHLVLRKNYFAAKKKSSLSIQDARKNGLRIFISGGGARNRLYKIAIDTFARGECLNLIDMGDQYFDHIDHTDEELCKNWNRLSVAYGLTIDKDVIYDRIVLPDEIPNNNGQDPIRELDRDDIYSK